MKKLLFLLLAVSLFSCTTTSDKAVFPLLKGDYLGQTLPVDSAAIFAPGIISTGMYTRDITISPDGNEIYFCVSVSNFSYATILCSKRVDGIWQSPEIVSFSGGPGILDLEPALTPDGNRIYFLSTRPDGDEAPGDQDIWYVDREGDDWGEAVNPGAPLNTDGGEFFPSPTKSGNLYYTHSDRGSALNRVFRTRWNGSGFEEPELLPDQVNCGVNRFNAFADPDEDYLIVPAVGMPDSYDGVDYYIVYRDSTGNFGEPVNMGAKINKGNPRGWSPWVSRDKKVLFFMASFMSDTLSVWNFEELKRLHNSPGNGGSSIYWICMEDLEI